jgi:enterochelin esterase-like enzyme
MTRLVLALLALVVASLSPAHAAEPANMAETGRLIEYRDVAAAGLPAQRLTIWLPPGYNRDTSTRYPVLYMHDGHNLFDVANSNFNKIWAADKAMLAASANGTVRPHIIVGIWAPGKDRYRQYLPRPAYDAAPPALRAQMDQIAAGPVISDAYLAWLSGPLKQWVDASFRTRPGRDDTAIAGSSMGGLMSCYAFVKRPDIYGRAACVSTHWPAADPAAPDRDDAALAAYWRGWFAARLGKADGRRLWLDHGTATLDAYYAPYQQQVDLGVTEAGWTRGTDWESKVYEGAEHEENAWAARLPEVFRWLLAG